VSALTHLWLSSSQYASTLQVLSLRVEVEHREFTGGITKKAFRLSQELFSFGL